MKNLLYIFLLSFLYGCSASDESLADRISNCPLQINLIAKQTYDLILDPNDTYLNVIVDSNYFYVVEYLLDENITRIAMLDLNLNMIVKRDVVDFIVEDGSSGNLVGRNSSSFGIRSTDTVSYKSIDMISGEISMVYEVEMPKYNFSTTNSTNGKHYYMQSLRDSTQVILYEFDPMTQYLPDPIYTLDTLLAKSANRYTVINDNEGELFLLISFGSNVAKVNLETEEIEYLYEPIFSSKDAGNLRNIQMNNSFMRASSSLSSGFDLRVNVHTFEKFKFDYEIHINDTLILKGIEFYNPENEKGIVFNRELEFSNSSTFNDLSSFYIEPWEYYLIENSIYLYDYRITRKKLMKYDFSSHCTIKLHNMDSQLVKLDQKNGIAYLLDNEGLKKFELD